MVTRAKEIYCSFHNEISFLLFQLPSLMTTVFVFHQTFHSSSEHSLASVFVDSASVAS